MTQSHVVDEVTARAMFPTFPVFVAGDGENAVRFEPPTITWLAGPIMCERCDGEGVIALALDVWRCPPCDARGYPSSLEIVSRSPNFWLEFQSHGSVDLGAPVRVVYVLDPIGDSSDEEEVVIGQDRRIWLKGIDITDAIAGTVNAGGVCYPISWRPGRLQSPEAETS